MNEDVSCQRWTATEDAALGRAFDLVVLGIPNRVLSIHDRENLQSVERAYKATSDLTSVIKNTTRKAVYRRLFIGTL